MKPLLWLSAMLLCLGCGSTQSYWVLLGTPGETYSGPVSLYTDEQPGPDPSTLEEVAIVQLSSFGDAIDRQEVLEALKAQARKLGCNAMLRVHIDTSHSRAIATGVAVRAKRPRQGR